MSIRYLAIQLYQLIKRVENLEGRLKQAGPEERGKLEAELYVARRERDQCRKILEAKKD